MRIFLYIKHYLIVLLMGMCLSISAQQIPHFSQFNYNSNILNPAATGINDYYEGQSYHRYQWEGITDAPRTYLLSVNGPSKNAKHGFGGHFFTDNVGPTRRTGFGLSYAYHLPINDDMILSAGAAAGLLQFMIDGSKVTLREQNDVLLQSVVYKSLVPDLSIGVFVHQENFYAGISIPQVIGSQLNLVEDEPTTGILSRHFQLIGGYHHELNDDIKLSPSLLVKYVSPAPIQAELQIMGTYKEKVSLGVGYRLKDAITAAVGYHFEYFSIGYNYDVTMSNIRKYSTGTHEFRVAVRFFDQKVQE